MSWPRNYTLKNLKCHNYIYLSVRTDGASYRFMMVSRDDVVSEWNPNGMTICCTLESDYNSVFR